MKARELLLSACVAALSWTTACGTDGGECTVPDGVEPDWIRVIRCESDYELLWDERSDAVFAHTRSINWLIDREDDNRIYFIDTEKWVLHFFFAEAYLEVEGRTPVGTHAEFNILNYRRDNRRFILGKLVRYVDQDLLTMELAAGDTAGADMIVEAFGMIADSIYDGDRLYYRPVSNDQEALLGDLEGRIPLIRTEEVFRGQTYQPLNQVVGFGTLRFRRIAELAARPVAPTDIVVLDRVPNDISLVSGIITDEFQTPLSHVNILSKNRGTPNMALRGAFDDSDLRAMDGQLVQLRVSAQDFELLAATQAEAEAYWEGLRPSEELIPQFDLTVDALVDLTGVGLDTSVAVGAKAASIGEMSKIGSAQDPLPLPDRPFAIPFAFYQRHLDDNGLAAEIDDLLADVAAGALEPQEVEARLFALRWALFTAPMNEADLAVLAAEIDARWGPSQRVRFRSSTNVEDLSEFSGAGLYTSAGAALDEGAEAIADAVKVVWASAWNYQAFVERDFYRVDHSRVRMGVLVHPAFVDELANGVAVTINEFAENRPAFYINSQVGEVSVTNPTGQAIPEQILYYTWYEEPEYEVITRSSLLAGIPEWPAAPAVLSDTELEALAHHLERIHNHFRALYPPDAGFAMDVEFKLVEGRQVVIKQARPLAHR